MWLWLWLALALAAGWLTLCRPTWGLLAVAVAIPFDRPLEFGLTIHTTEMFLAAALAAWVWRAVRGRVTLRSAELAAVGVLLGTMALSAIHAPDLAGVLKQVLRWAQPAVLAMMIGDCLRREADVRTWQNVLLGLGAVVSVYGLAQVLLGPGEFLPNAETLTLDQGRVLRAFATFGHPNQLAGYLLLLLPLGLIRTAQARSGRELGLLLTVFLLMAAALAFTFSRGAWLAAAAVLAPLTAKYVPRRILTWLGAGAAALILLLLVLPGPAAPLRQAVQARIASFSQPQQDHSVSFRQTAAQAGWQMFQQHPWTGIGGGAYAGTVLKFLPPDYYAKTAMLTHVHNLYLQILVETGIVGLLGFLIWVGYYVQVQVRGLRMPGGEARAWLVGCLAASAAFLIHNAFDVLTVFARGAHWAVILGLGTALARGFGRKTTLQERESSCRQ